MSDVRSIPLTYEGVVKELGDAWEIANAQGRERARLSLVCEQLAERVAELEADLKRAEAILERIVGRSGFDFGDMESARTLLQHLKGTR